MSNKSIIVPIAAQVIVVPNKNKVSKLDLSSRLNSDKNLGEEQQFDLNNLFNTTKKEYLKKGIHIHWKLPKALKHGIANDNGEIQFPTVPNRWMVVRYQTNLNSLTNIHSKTWLIKSDKIIEDKQANWVVLEETYEEDTRENNGETIKKQKYIFKKIGVNEEWNNSFTENKNEAVDLTAVGAINPYFSEIYDDCNSVFGFWDEMIDEPLNNTFAYVITGWYSNSLNDPLNPKTKTSVEIVSKIKRNWTTSTDTTIIENSIFSTTIQSVNWTEAIQNNGLNSEITVTLGDTTTEAFSALLVELNKDKVKQLPNIEVYLNALQNNLLESEKDLPNLQKLEIENHKKQFTPKQRGIIWEIKKIDKNTFADKENTLPHFPFENELVECLKTLNQFQIQFNANQEKLKSSQQEYYFSWYKSVLAETRTIANSNIESVKQNIQIDLDKSKQDIEHLKKSLENFKLKITNEINIINKFSFIQTPLFIKDNADYELIQLTEDRFWEPNDPAILFYGDGLGNLQHFNQDINDTVSCRITSDIVDRLKINSNTINSEDFFKLKDFNINNINIPSDVINKLVLESLTLNENLALLIAQKIEGNNRDVNSEIIKEYANQHVIQFQKEAKEKIEKFAIQQQNQTWQPQFVLWEVAFLPSNSKKEIICRGFNPLTNGIAKNLNEHLSQDFENPFQQVLAQNLSGFNKQLVAQMPYMQLPPVEFKTDEDGDFSTDLIIDEEVLKLIDTQGNAYGIACNPFQKTFSPVRNGKLSFRKIALVDTFGRTQTIIGDNVIPTLFSSKSLNLNVNNSKPSIELKNRIVQPTRLQFNWLNQKEEILNQDTGKLDHPILGWLVPNYLDNMLMIYDATGKEIKAIRITDSKKIEEFFPSNDGMLTAALIKENRIKNNNAALNEIIDNLDIEKIITDSKKLNEKIVKTAANNSVISLLYGKPIAIAKGEIRMDLLGNANINPMWSTDDTAAIENHKISIKIGNKELSNDGLLGYYLNNNYSQLVFTDKETKIEISPNNKPINVTVLLSANSGFYIDSDGYLPTKFVSLHKHATEELINDISISFMLCPFMADKENPKIPVPSTPNSNWNWIHKSNVEVWNNPEEIKKQNNDETFNFNTQQFYEGWIKLEEFKQKQS